MVSDELEACFFGGETAVRDSVFIPILLNGVEDHYWSYSLIPMYENGRAEGIYDACPNTMQIVVGADRLARARRC